MLHPKPRMLSQAVTPSLQFLPVFIYGWQASCVQHNHRNTILQQRLSNHQHFFIPVCFGVRNEELKNLPDISRKFAAF